MCLTSVPESASHPTLCVLSASRLVQFESKYAGPFYWCLLLRLSTSSQCVCRLSFSSVIVFDGCNVVVARLNRPTVKAWRFPRCVAWKGTSKKVLEVIGSRRTLDGLRVDSLASSLVETKFLADRKEGQAWHEEAKGHNRDSQLQRDVFVPLATRHAG